MLSLKHRLQIGSEKVMILIYFVFSLSGSNEDNWSSISNKIFNQCDEDLAASFDSSIAGCISQLI